MAITATSKGEAREFVPEGNYFGVCVGVFDLGTQPSEKYSPTHKVILQFELHKKKGVCRDRNNKPLLISGFFPLSFGKRKDGTKAKLRQAVEGILGRSFSDAEAKEGYDITELIDRACRLKVAHERDEKGNTTFDFIETFMPLDDDDPEIRPESDGVVYELDPASEIPDSVPEWIRKQVHKSEEWTKAHGKAGAPAANGGRPTRSGGQAKAAVGAAAGADDDDDETPF